MLVIFNKQIPIETLGSGDLPLLIVGPASLFKKDHLLSPEFKRLFKIYFVDIFISVDEGPTTSGLTLDDFVASIEKIRLYINEDKIALFAHSASGVLAMKYAMEYPERVLCNFIVATAPFWGVKKEVEVNSFFNYRNARSGRLSAYKHNLGNFQQREHDIPSRERFFQRYYARTPQFYFDYRNPNNLHLWDGINLDITLVENYFSAISKFNVFTNYPFSQTHVPTFLAFGLYDFSNPFYAWLDRAKELYHVDYHIFMRSGHFPMVEEPHEFDRVVTDFLVQHDLYRNNIATSAFN